MDDHCAHVLYPETGGLYPSPAEHCTAEAAPGSVYCTEHDPDQGWPDEDLIHDMRLEDTE